MLDKVYSIYSIVVTIIFNVEVNSECQTSNLTQFWSTTFFSLNLEDYLVIENLSV